METILRHFNREEDGCWRRFYDCILTRERPKDLEQLGYIYYVFEVVRPALLEVWNRTTRSLDKRKIKGTLTTNKSKSKSKPRRLILNVDDPAEHRIYSRAQEILRKFRQKVDEAESNLVEVYICRQVLVNRNQDRARLYHQDPIPEAPTSSDPDRETILPVDVVSQLYGSECAHNPKQWFSKAGSHV